MPLGRPIRRGPRSDRARVAELVMVGERRGGQCKWGRHCCRPHSHQRVATPCSDDVRRTFHRGCCGAYLAPDVWPLHIRSCDVACRDCSPALAPASGFRSCPAASFGARSPRHPLPCAFAWPRLCNLPFQACGGTGLAPPSITRSGQFPSLSGGSASLPSRTSRLAFGRSLPHATSRRARGQVPPPSLGSKPSELQGLAAFRSGWFVSRRQVEIAPQPAIWQDFQG